MPIFQKILSSPSIIDKMDGYEYFHNWLGEGLLTSTGQKWFNHRKMITPTFHFKILNEFLDVFNKNSNRLIDYLESFSNLQVIDFQKIAYLYTLDVICETSMGVELNCLNNPTSSFIKGINT